MTGAVNDITDLYQVIDGKKVWVGQAPKDYAIKRNKRKEDKSNVLRTENRSVNQSD